MASAPTCPECGKSNLYKSVEVSSGGGHAPNYLPGLGGVFTSAKFRVVLCKDCGLTRYYASKEALEKIPTSAKWQKA